MKPRFEALELFWMNRLFGWSLLPLRAERPNAGLCCPTRDTVYFVSEKILELFTTLNGGEPNTKGRMLYAMAHHDYGKNTNRG
uniref:Uncharacterized protein n=1 Tax=Candidatus Kentrum sp. TC TaxID=2126339 RepID=A0A450YIL4_9GAMM|nr:MAG: hypothetical protein BECKTC1821E_GA0114239_101133 [Candidatus Kentron sp. TC]